MAGPNGSDAIFAGETFMSDDLDQADGAGGKHAAGRQLAEQALRAQAAGDDDEAERLFAAAERADPQAVIAVLEEHRDDPATTAVPETQDDELAAESRTVEPGADAPSRAGVSGRGSGADTQGT